ncbi:kinase-like domain-containing protein [Lipomyces kononenkoae]
MHNISPVAPQLTPPSYSSISTSPYAPVTPAMSGYSPSTANAVLPPAYRSQYGTTTPVQYSPTQYYSQMNMSPLHSNINQAPAYHLTPVGTSPGRASLVNQFQSLNVDSNGRRVSTAVLLSSGVQQDVLKHLAVPPPAPAFAKVRSRVELVPKRNSQPQHRRANPEGGFMSPLQALTLHIPATYRICNPAFKYESSRNPRRVLTKPSKGSKNNGYDNDESDYILYVNDILGGNKDQQKYLILDILGQGTFGQVVKCQNLKTQEVVAVKVIKNKPAYFNQSMMEVSILEHLNTAVDRDDEHHLLRLLDKFIHREHLCLVFELLSSNLYDLIKQNQFRGLSTNLVRVFAQQLLDAMCVLKDAKLIHCDLKPENILLKNLESPVIKIIDFGSACHERQTVYTYIQSRFYRSPEVILGLPYSSSIDMWSLGCIVAELFLGLPLFPGSSEYNQISRIVEMLGMPPTWMIEMGKQAPGYFEKVTTEYGEKSYRLKSMEKYSREHKTNEQPSKRYFAASNLADIVRTYPMPKRNMKPAEIEREMQNRETFIDFVKCLLNLNPLERWTPQQAKMHPFIANSKYGTQSIAHSDNITTTQHNLHKASIREDDSANSIRQGQSSQSYGYTQPNNAMQQTPQALTSQHLEAPSYYAPPQYGTNPSNTTVTSNPYPPHQGMFVASSSTSSRSGRPRAVTIGQVDPIPPKLQRVGNLIDPTQAIRAQPSPAYFPPPEIAEMNDEDSKVGGARNRRRSQAQQYRHGDIIRNLEDGLSTSYWS